MKYFFVSFSNYNGLNLGACIVRVNHLQDVLDECKRLGINPPVDHEARVYPLVDENFPEQEMELNKLYSREELIQKGFERDTQ